MRDLAQRLRGREPIFGGWTSLGHPSITEIFSRAGVDFVGIDLEHSTISLEQAQGIIAAAHGGASGCLARIASHNGEQIRRLLDSGADGVIVPNVTSLEEVQRIVEWSKYPPVGRRSYGIARAQGYGLDFEEYTSTWNERSAIILQIESVAGVKAVQDLVGHPAVDGVMIGPYDISGSLGIPGQLTHPRVKEAARAVLEAARRQGKGCGTQLIEPTSSQVAEAFKEGYSFVILASDVFLLWKWSERMQTLVSAHRQTVKVETDGD